MIDKPIETVMRQSKRDILIPADLVATVNEDNNLQHAFLVLTKVKYAKIPVLDNNNHFKGLISLSMITEQMLLDTGITTRPLDSMKIKEIMQKDVPTIYERENLEVILRHLVNENFIPYVDHDNKFLGIITRRELFKEINFLAHNFSKRYVALPVYHEKTVSQSAAQ
ncbi:cyclic-di-AMP-binding protein CbpB [Lentilactobacillus hilgardii]|uniref:cyclic-di-AMP-binding protein CbpB n=1 Tax=Lentilactobacillus hilgardii TaxID=1588 RepID=UPI00390C9915